MLEILRPRTPFFCACVAEIQLSINRVNDIAERREVKLKKSVKDAVGGNPKFELQLGFIMKDNEEIQRLTALRVEDTHRGVLSARRAIEENVQIILRKSNRVSLISSWIELINELTKQGYAGFGRRSDILGTILSGILV